MCGGGTLTSAMTSCAKNSIVNGAHARAHARGAGAHVGIGSAADDLSGKRRTALMTSSLVGGWKAVKDTPGRTALKVGGSASFVLDCTFSTFSVKKRLNSSTSIVELAGTRPRPRRVSTDFHSFLYSLDWTSPVYLTSL